MKHRLLSSSLLDWYNANQRDLPWRNTREPYAIWVSEIILQQTRVAQGIGYFKRFLQRFPTLESLALASLDEVLKIWQGLGYYTRARNMHEGAKQLMAEYNGVFPGSSASLKKIKGIGEYTSAAIASISFNEPVPVVDGNVYRVISRLFAIDAPIDKAEGKHKVTRLASEMLDFSFPGDFNQAIMELGAVVCTPRKPACEDCPVKIFCKAYHLGTMELFPVKSRRQATRDRFFNYMVMLYNNSVFLSRRNSKDIWEGMYEFPLIESTSRYTPGDFALASREFLHPGTVVRIDRSRESRHVLSHQVVHATFWVVHLGCALPSWPENWIRVDKDKVQSYPVSRLIEKFLEDFDTR